ncbi:phage antirepressor N-terminal domain-containing protein [Tenacibaculum dicentrarchi]|uniref:phage antirepressor N-terminal domain-containing protein n=1 Tax=Tenacibaculum dicentrarchi TaxID=669041 RepID=UPI0035178BF8
MSAETTVVARINEVNILITQDAEKRVAVRPICEALGVSVQKQLERLKEDSILGSTITLGVMVGGDGKTREMQTIPLKYVFGWLFKINPKNVKEEARENLIKYQEECYDVFYNYFSARSEFIEIKQSKTEKQLEVLKGARTNFRNTSKILKEAEAELMEIRKFSFEDFKAEKNQVEIKF